MSVDNIPSNPTPLWVKIVIIVAMLPVLSFPWMLAASRGAGVEMDAFLWFYPVYVLAAGICAWVVYGRRPELTWILIALLLLTHAGMWYLVSNPPVA
ncbi:MAG: hypothetical protein HDS78_09305 [Bacteroidales bacterium]|nr:hypothetical protein [Bacteroidales bacterium]MDE6437836.1 hypothetical protein [Muribaculaceae bacterium]